MLLLKHVDNIVKQKTAQIFLNIMSKLSELKPVEQQVTQWLSRMGWELRTPEEMNKSLFLRSRLLYIINCKLK